MSGNKRSKLSDLLNTPAPSDYDNFGTPPVVRLKKEHVEKMSFLDFYKKFVAPLMAKYPLVIVRPVGFTSEIQDLNKLSKVKVTPKIQHITMNDSGVGFVKQWDEQATTLEKFWKAQPDKSEFIGGQDKVYFSKKLLKVRYVNDIEYLNLKVTNAFNMDKNLGLDQFGPLSGINQSWGYAGTAGSCSPFHNEDNNFGSMNHHEGGADKNWYGVNYEDNEKLTKKLAEILPIQFQKCPNYLRHKSIVVDPGKISSWGIDVWKVVQKKGDYVITGAGCFHQIYNEEKNLCRADNFLPPDPRSLKIVQEAESCSCELGENRLPLPIYHPSEKLFKCLNKSCDKKFDTPWSVVRHLKKCSHGIQYLTVGDIPPVMCPYCGEEKDRLDTHIKKVHKKEQPGSVCSLCRQRFLDINKHLVSCRQCKFCKATFYRSRQQAIDHCCTFAS